MRIFFDERDIATHEGRGSRLLYWLDDIGGVGLTEAKPDDTGFLFAGARSIDDYRKLVARFPRILDRADARGPLMRLDSVLDTLAEQRVDVATPRTWRMPLDKALPEDLTYPLFLRTATSSLKLGGNVSRVKNLKELETESAELRRLLGWDAVILARAWLDLAEAGTCVYGSVPEEVRTWIVDGEPFAWSFHYLNVVKSPKGFPPSAVDLSTLRTLSRRVGSVFTSRLIAADFARTARGEWMFIEAGPGSAAGTGHEQVFKAVACRLLDEHWSIPENPVGGLFE
jgi:hypothetical protein